MTNLIGHSLGRYHILEQLGQGGMATVYKAYDTRLERDVAVKVLRTDQFPPATLERILKRFEREARALAKLTHPNIVGIIDYGEHEGAPYLVMEYLPGGTLKQRLKDLGRPIPWQEALRLLLPIARALDYAHQHNILHRDVKPSNILLTEQGEPMLTDFGIAKILDLEDGQTLTATGVGVGTPEYMSPEQGLGKPVDARTDVYSLGVVLYEMVTGRKPFVADTPIAVVLKQATEPLPRPTQFAPGLPEAVEKILLKALAKQPEDRYGSMAEMAAAIEKAIVGQQPAESRPQTHEPPPHPAERPIFAPSTASSPRRFPGHWVFLGLSVFVLCLCTVLGAGLSNLGVLGPGLATHTFTPTHTLKPTLTLTSTPAFTATSSFTPTHTSSPTSISTPTVSVKVATLYRLLSHLQLLAALLNLTPQLTRLSPDQPIPMIPIHIHIPKL